MKKDTSCWKEISHEAFYFNLENMTYTLNQNSLKIKFYKNSFSNNTFSFQLKTKKINSYFIC